MSTSSTINIPDIIKEEISKTVKNKERINILIVGGSGVGKSSHINTVFNKDLTKVGNIQSATKSTEMFSISDPDLPVCIFDTEGLELGRQTEEIIKKNCKFVSQRRKEKDPIFTAKN